MPRYNVALDSVAHYSREASIPYGKAPDATAACRAACDGARGHDRPLPSGGDGEGWDVASEVFRARPVRLATRAGQDHLVEVSLKTWACRNEHVEADGPDGAVDAALDTDDPPGWPTDVDGWRLVHVEFLTACDAERLDGPGPGDPAVEGGGLGPADDDDDDEAVLGP